MATFATFVISKFNMDRPLGQNVDAVKIRHPVLIEKAVRPLSVDDFPHEFPELPK